MDNDRIETLLLKLLEDVSQIKVKLDRLEKMENDTKELEDRVDKLESNQTTIQKTINSLEHRANTMEEYVRTELNDSKKKKKGIFISAGLAVFGAIVSFVMNII